MRGLITFLLTRIFSFVLKLFFNLKKQLTQNSKKENLKDVLFIKQKPYKQKLLCFGLSKENFFTNKGRNPYKTSLYPGQGKRSKSESKRLLRSVNNSWDLNGFPVAMNPVVRYEVWHILSWTVVRNGVNPWRS